MPLLVSLTEARAIYLALELDRRWTERWGDPQSDHCNELMLLALARVATVVELFRVEVKATLERVARILFEIYNYNVYQGGLMQVSKWGNSLAVRLPTAVVDALDLKEGDQIEIRIARERVFEVSRDQTKPHALARLRKLRRALPPGFVFDREEANAR